jgi:hypothetical protein
MNKRNLILLSVIMLVCVASARAQTVTELLRTGDNGSKKNLVIIGDGFQTGDQSTFNQYIEDNFIHGMFEEGALRETMGAFNIYRINVDSTDSGVTQVDSNGNVTTQRNTALQYRYSGVWTRCWMEPTTKPNPSNPQNPTDVSQGLIDTILNNLVPQRDYVVLVLNDTSPQNGGCSNGFSQLAVTRQTPWFIIAHEMGHMVGNLGDEYTGAQNYTGPELGVVNLTNSSARATLKWSAFVDPATNIVTAQTDVADETQDAGAFAGATIGQNGYTSGIFRPVWNCRMNGNSPTYCPVCYDRIRQVLAPFHDHAYREAYAGDFNGDGKGDVVMHNANSLALYTSSGSELAPQWVSTAQIAGWDFFTPNDKFFVGDFDGDGKDDLYVFNFGDYNVPYFGMLRSTGNGFECVRRFDKELPGWDSMSANDKFFVADFDGDGKDDLYAFNRLDFNIGYLEMLRSTGGDLEFVRRYDDVLPGWDRMMPNDLFFVADFDGDKRQDLYVFNGKDYGGGYLEMLRSTGSEMTNVFRYDTKLPMWEEMMPDDQFYVADFDGDKKQDLYVFNGLNYGHQYLGMLRSDGTQLSGVNRFDDVVPGWGFIGRHDRYFVADVNGDGKDDLYGYNAADFDTEYLGYLGSSGGDLSGSWQNDWVDDWNLGAGDKFLVANFNGGSGWDDLFVFNDDWFGMLQSYKTSSGLVRIYPQWIHNHKYHSLGWW